MGQGRAGQGSVSLALLTHRHLSGGAPPQVNRMAMERERGSSWPSTSPGDPLLGPLGPRIPWEGEEPAPACAIGVHDPDLPGAGSVGEEGDVLTVGGPGSQPILSRVVSELLLSSAGGTHLPYLPIAIGRGHIKHLIPKGIGSPVLGIIADARGGASSCIDGVDAAVVCRLPIVTGGEGDSVAGPDCVFAAYVHPSGAIYRSSLRGLSEVGEDLHFPLSDVEDVDDAGAIRRPTGPGIFIVDAHPSSLPKCVIGVDLEELKI